MQDKKKRAYGARFYRFASCFWTDPSHPTSHHRRSVKPLHVVIGPMLILASWFTRKKFNTLTHLGSQKSDLDHGKTGNSLEIAEVQRRYFEAEMQRCRADQQILERKLDAHRRLLAFD
jgi:hypothetical protein